MVGITDSNHNLPLGKLKEIRSVAGSTSLTFHRAFDVVKNPLEALEQLIDVGFNTILTAGQKEHAADGFELLKQLKSLSNGALDIMPGGGISHLNCALFTDPKFDWIRDKPSLQLIEIEVDLRVYIFGLQKPRRVMRYRVFLPSPNAFHDQLSQESGRSFA